MKISTDPDHVDYHLMAHSCSFWLAGAERNNVVFADEEGRFAITIVLDDRGAPIMNKANTEVLTAPFHGDVRIDAPDWLRTECDARAKYGQKPIDLGDVIYP